jgi:hypothetical protein
MVCDKLGNNLYDYTLIDYHDKFEAMRAAAWQWSKQTGRNDDCIYSCREISA